MKKIILLISIYVAIFGVLNAEEKLTRTEATKVYAYNWCYNMFSDGDDVKQPLCSCVANEVDVISLYEAIRVSFKNEKKGTSLMSPIMLNALNKCNK